MLSNARDTLLTTLLAKYEPKIIDLYKMLYLSLPDEEGITPFEVGTRAYIGSLLDFLSYSNNISIITRIAESQYMRSRTMTLQLSALKLLQKVSDGERHPYMQKFIDLYKNNALVIMKYFSIIGSSQHERIISSIENTQNEIFYEKNLPNHAKALFGAFTKNLKYFHKKDGSGYALLTDFILSIDTINPHTAARMAGAFKMFPKLNPLSQDTLRPYLQKILQKEGLSTHTTEIIHKILYYNK